ncbi:deoxynucleotide monophosphate kinase [Oricola thermophila]|uniref:Deoxynucleotide monophosphate kinase n=1 Tax=Oricola thermophila TaxID=2742145 RepID=A0A6N1VCS4_9HYPH|nr:deoxynucleotide monophosphate kinase [Oricola thermophila]QKV18700.1 deoxynucleotide monophosphate kinase [Oricola thermophila]
MGERGGMTKRVIALAGPIGAGKSTAAQYLADRHGYERIRFAAPLKSMMRAFYASAGLDPVEIEARIEGGLKEAPDPVLLGRTPRRAMQTLGTEWGRNLIAPELWVHAWSGAARRAGLVVAEDCRFANEAAAVRELGGIVIGIECPWRPRPADGHASEDGVEVDVTIANDKPGNPETMFRRLDEVLAEEVSGFRTAGSAA